MKICYDCGETATRVLMVPYPQEQDYYCDTDSRYQEETGYPTKAIVEE